MVLVVLLQMGAKDLTVEEVFSATELGECCFLSWTKVLRMGQTGGRGAALLTESWEERPACARAEDNLGKCKGTIPQDVKPPPLDEAHPLGNVGVLRGSGRWRVVGEEPLQEGQ